jgi:hypothetical protein
MKVSDTPRTGTIGPVVYFESPFGLCCRTRIVPRDPRSEAQSLMRSIFGASSSEFGLKLSENERQLWITAAQTVPSHPSLNQYARISGQQFLVKINSTLRLLSRPAVRTPPEPVVFSPRSASELVIANDPEEGVRLLLNVGIVPEDLMVFGQPPCSAGRMKCRRVYYLGLAEPATNGQRDITDLYAAKFGQPRPGQKVFIVTCQTRNGWKGPESLTSAIVPPPSSSDKQEVPAKTEVTTPTPAVTPQSQAVPAQGASPLSRSVYKGSTPDARGVHQGTTHVHPLSIPWAPLVHGFRVALARLGALGIFGVRAGSASSSFPAPAVPRVNQGLPTANLSLIVYKIWSIRGK